jgi:hypothetical protein
MKIRRGFMLFKVALTPGRKYQSARHLRTFFCSPPRGPWKTDIPGLGEEEDILEDVLELPLTLSTGNSHRVNPGYVSRGSAIESFEFRSEN